MHLLFRDQDKNKIKLRTIYKMFEVYVCEITYIGTDSLTGTGTA